MESPDAAVHMVVCALQLQYLQVLLCQTGAELSRHCRQDSFQYTVLQASWRMHPVAATLPSRSVLTCKSAELLKKLQPLMLAALTVCRYAAPASKLSPCAVLCEKLLLRIVTDSASWMATAAPPPFAVSASTCRKHTNMGSKV